MIRLGAVLVLVTMAGAAQASFRPVEDRRYRYETVETRSADGVVRRFHTSRSIVFHRTTDGYDAVVTLEAFDQQAGADVGKMFDAATASLLHRPLRYHLDATGRILTVENADTAIALIADAIERLSADRARSLYAEALASPLRTLSPARKQAMLVSILTSTLAGIDADRQPGTRAVSLPSRPPLAPGTALAGTETVSRNAAGIVTIDTQAGGGMDAPALAGTPVAAGTAPVATIHAVRNVDPATGLIHDSRDVSEATISDGTETHRSRIETVVTLTLPAK